VDAGFRRLDASLADMRHDLNHRLANLETDFTIQSRNTWARLKNGQRLQMHLPLEPLCFLDADTRQISVPPGFPATQADLEGMRGDQVDAILACYGLPRNGTVTDRKWAVKSYIGLPGY